MMRARPSPGEHTVNLSRWVAMTAASVLTAAAAVVAAPTATAATCPAPGGQPSAAAPGPADAEFLIQGHGWGHSMGMSQYGAQGAATLGCTSTDILTTYYAGLRVADRDLHHRVLIDMLTNGPGFATVLAESGPVVWRTTSAAGETLEVVQPQGTTWAARRDGSGLKVRSGPSLQDPSVPGLQYVEPGQKLRVDHPGTVVRVRTYTSSGSVHLDRRASYDFTTLVGTDRGLTVREVMEDNARGQAVQKYLRGIAEMPVSWHIEAHKAQMIAARTYLLGKFNATEQGYLILPTPSHQNWLGTTQEERDRDGGGKQREAVRLTTTETGGHVLVTSSGAVARDVLYTSSHGGWSESNAFVYGTTPVPHLRALDDSRWDAAGGNPYRSWTVGASAEQLGRAFGMDTVLNVSVPPQGDPQRTVVTVSGLVDGQPVVRDFTGWDTRQRLQNVLGTAVRSPGMTFVRQVVDTTGAVPVSGDVDGDGVTDIGWFNAGQWAFRTADGKVLRAAFGQPGDEPVVGDFNDDGRDDVGVFRGGTWLVRFSVSGGPAQMTFSYGREGDLPLAGRWAGSTRDGVAVVRGKQWFVRATPTSGVAHSSFTWGRDGDVPVVGAWLGDGVDRPGLVRGKNWYLGTSIQRPRTVWSFAVGRPTDLPLVGDWDGDGVHTGGLVRDTTFFRLLDHEGRVAPTTVEFRG